VRIGRTPLPPKTSARLVLPRTSCTTTGIARSRMTASVTVVYAKTRQRAPRRMQMYDYKISLTVSNCTAQGVLVDVLASLLAFPRN
jgi:hypothetical protein